MVGSWLFFLLIIVWSLELGTWNLELGTRHRNLELELRIWNLEFGMRWKSVFKHHLLTQDRPSHVAYDLAAS